MAIKEEGIDILEIDDSDDDDDDVLLVEAPVSKEAKKRSASEGDISKKKKKKKRESKESENSESEDDEKAQAKKTSEGTQKKKKRPAEDFVCPECNKGPFSSFSARNEHVKKVHTEDKVPCEYCKLPLVKHLSNIKRHHRHYCPKFPGGDRFQK